MGRYLSTARTTIAIVAGGCSALPLLAIALAAAGFTAGVVAASGCSPSTPVSSQAVGWGRAVDNVGANATVEKVSAAALFDNL